MKVLLTGFEAFLGLESNPTEYIVKELDGITFGEKKIIGRILPVDFQKSKDIIQDLITEHNPNQVISLGVAVGRNRITPERIAINCMDGEKDNTGNSFIDKLIFEDGPDAYFSTLPIRKMVAALKEQSIPAKISNTAGTYLCNQAMYAARHYIASHDLDIEAGFVHVPAHHDLVLDKPSVPSWALDDLKRAVEVILST
ncbi:pyroglutamyl-peptidase I [Thalassobacillus devorans]|uniref:pyroglutamyl-peptidase I n=1 Tax=Thalassobacillus devorans TaxID=279813 RepID=UPI00048DAF40|nr:pyroglutamyl-peptidase I [Thalassobacillus devorans]